MFLSLFGGLLMFPFINGKLSSPPFGANTSVLPPLWGYGVDSAGGVCWQDGGNSSDPLNFLLGPFFVNTVNMTAELCVNTCDRANYRLAGLHDGNKCLCANAFNPHGGFESLDGLCTIPCAGNPNEACGGQEDPEQPLVSLYEKQGDGRCDMLFGMATFTSGDWRFVYWFNDTVGARALKHNAVDLHPGHLRGNLTIDGCTTACAASGFRLAGLEFADECYCGNELDNNSQAIPSADFCFGDDSPSRLSIHCTGNSSQLCGGPNILAVYALPGTTLTPIIPFGSVFNGL